MTLNSGCFDFFIPFPLFFISPGPTLEIGGMGSFFDAYFIEKKLSLAKRNKKKNYIVSPKSVYQPHISSRWAPANKRIEKALIPVNKIF